MFGAYRPIVGVCIRYIDDGIWSRGFEEAEESIAWPDSFGISDRTACSSAEKSSQADSIGNRATFRPRNDIIPRPFFILMTSIDTVPCPARMTVIREAHTESGPTLRHSSVLASRIKFIPKRTHISINFDEFRLLTPIIWCFSL